MVPGVWTIVAGEAAGNSTCYEVAGEAGGLIFSKRWIELAIVWSRYAAKTTKRIRRPISPRLSVATPDTVALPSRA
jgi:hypothetical protein